MALALYRKYRPQDFDHLKGQSAVRQTLMQALKTGRLAHAYLFAGPRGTGKTSSARLIAKAIQCEDRQDNGQACGKCDVCERSARGDLVDLVEIDAASNRGIDEIRELRDTLRFAPTYSKSKVYIIDEVHMLTKEAFNALLKSLEEPPEHVFFILATTELHKIPETILSRCQRYEFKRISVDQIVERLTYIANEEKISFQPAALELLAKHADGGMRDAISMLEQFASEEITEELVGERLGLSKHASCQELFVALGSGDTQAALKIVEELHREGYNLQQFTLSFLGHLRNKLHEAVAGSPALVSKLLNWIHLFDEAWLKLKRASIAQLPLEIAVIRATHGASAPAPREVPEDVEVAPVVKAAPAPVAKATPAPVAAAPAAAPAPKPVKQEKRPEGLVHIQAVKTQMPAVLKAIKNPGLRMSLQTGNLKSIENDVLSFVFSSTFQYDKVSNAEASVKIEAAFKEVLGKAVKFKPQLDEGVAATADLGWEVIEEAL